MLRAMSTTVTDPTALAFLDGDGAPPAALPSGELEALVSALIERKDAARLSRLTGHTDKAAAKAAKKGLHTLRSRGVAVPEARPAGEPIRFAPPPPEPAPSFLSGWDGSGERMMWLCRPLASGVEILQGTVSESLGLTDASLGEMPRKGFRSWQQGLLQGHPEFPIAPVDPARLRWLFELAVQHAQALKRPIPPAYNRVRATLPPPVAPKVHSVIEHWLAAPEVSEAALVGLHRGACRAWLADRDALDRTAMRLGEVAQSALVVDEEQRKVQMRGALERGVDDWLEMPGVRARLRNRLLDQAEVLLGKLDEGEAGLLRAAADLFVEGGPPAARNPFARLLFDKVFRVEPPPAAPEEPRSPGGIILASR